MSIQPYSFAWVRDERTGIQEVVYIEDTYENFQGNKMCTVRYFLFAEDVERLVIGGRLLPKPREIFATPSLHEVSTESIEGATAEVLSLEDFERCRRLLRRNLASNAFLCDREYKNGFVRPFALSDLEGYSAQRILSSARRYEEEAVAMEEADESWSESESSTTTADD